MSEDIKGKLDIISEKLSNVVEDCKELKVEQREQTKLLHDHDIKLAEYNKQLEIHIEATKLLKKDLDSHKKQSFEQYEKLSEDISPIIDSKKGIAMLNRWIVRLGGLSAALLAIFKFLGYF